MFKLAEKGNIFVLTQSGYERTLEHIKPERAVGKPIVGFEYQVPASWIPKGFVEEVKETEKHAI